METSQRLIVNQSHDKNHINTGNTKQLRRNDEDQFGDCKRNGSTNKIWLVLTIALCFVLGSALVFSFIMYKNLKHAYNNRFSNTEEPKFTNSNKLVTNFQQFTQSEGYTSVLNISRLPHNVKPTYYKLKLRVDVNKLVFNGYCEIKVKCYQSTKFIILHSEQTLEHQQDPIVLDSLQNILPIRKTHVNNYYSYFSIELEDMMTSGNSYTIIFKSYQAPILSDLKGLYLSSYKLSNGTTR
jgi:hypothetical protein